MFDVDIIFDWFWSVLYLMLTLFLTDPDLYCVLCWHYFWLILICVAFDVDIIFWLISICAVFDVDIIINKIYHYYYHYFWLILVCVVFDVDIIIFDWSWSVLCFMLTSVFLTDLELCCVWCWHHYFWLISICVLFDVDIIFDWSRSLF